MTSWFKHQPGSYPVIFPKEMLPLITHVFSLQHRAAFFYKANGVAAGMGVNAMEYVFHSEIIVFTPSRKVNAKNTIGFATFVLVLATLREKFLT
jgi:hypothetical protein